ncbi:MAG: IPT/TIG domain-containing protein [Pseudomonadota bacterium]
MKRLTASGLVCLLVLVLFSAVAVSTCSKTSGSLTVTAISPAFGTSVGGVATTITGTGFLRGATVTLGGVPCSSRTVISETEIGCTTAAYPVPYDSLVDVAVTNLDNQSVKLTGGFTYSGGWQLIDGSATGLNKDGSHGAIFPFPGVNGTKLYVAWMEHAGTDPGVLDNQVRVAQFNGDTSNPGWTFVDGGGINVGLTIDARVPKLATWNSNLYAIWEEGPKDRSGWVYVKKFDGTSWTSVSAAQTSGGVGMNWFPLADGAELPVMTVFNNKLYVAWVEDDNQTDDHSSSGDVWQIRVAVYNGTSWKYIEKTTPDNLGINYDVTKVAVIPAIAVVNSKLYVGWEEKAADGLFHVRVKKYGGDDSAPSWTSVDVSATGLNRVGTRAARFVDLVDLGGVMYAGWTEPFVSTSPADQVRIASYNGNDASPSWTFVDGNDADKGINKDTSAKAIGPRMTVVASKLYASIFEQNAAGFWQTRVRLFNGTGGTPLWSNADGGGSNGLNADPTHDSGGSPLFSYGGKLCATWSEADSSKIGQVRVACQK